MSERVYIYFITNAKNINRREMYAKLGITTNLNMELLKGNMYTSEADQLILLHYISADRWYSHLLLERIIEKLRCSEVEKTGWMKLKKNYTNLLNKIMKNLSIEDFDPLSCKIAEVNAINPHELIINHNEKTLMSWEFCSMYGIDVCKNNTAIKLWNGAIDRSIAVDGELLTFLNFTSVEQFTNAMDELNLKYEKSFDINGLEMPYITLTSEQYETLATKYSNPKRNINKWPKIINILCRKYFEYTELCREVFSDEPTNSNSNNNNSNSNNNKTQSMKTDNCDSDDDDFLDVPIDFVMKSITEALYKENPNKKLPKNIKIFNNCICSRHEEKKNIPPPSPPPSPPSSIEDKETAAAIASITDPILTPIMCDKINEDFNMTDEAQMVFDDVFLQPHPEINKCDLLLPDFDDDVFNELNNIFKNDSELNEMFQTLIQ